MNNIYGYNPYFNPERLMRQREEIDNILSQMQQSQTQQAPIQNIISNQPATNLENLEKYYLIIACGVKATASLPVYIQTSDGNIPLLCKFGNEVYSNQLIKRYRYVLGYGNKNSSYTLGQFIVFNNLDCACPTTIASTNITANTTLKERK